MNFNSDSLRELITSWLGGGMWADYAATAVVMLLSTLLIWLVWRLFDRFRKGVHRWIDAEDRGIHALTVQDQQIFTAREISRFLHTAVNYLWILVRLVLVLAWLNLVFTQFEWSREVALYSFSFTGGVFRQIIAGIVAYLPNLLIIVIVAAISRVVMRMVFAFFEGIRLERISLPGFYPEWAQTSYGLTKLLIIATTLVIVFPYLPGSSSPAFQGLSIFFGVLVSLGSTSAVANVMSGIVITYTRAFKIGDRVRLSDTEGDVIERSAFVTRIRTPKNEEVAIPNAMVMNDHIVNFSAQAKETGVLLHTTVTIGYDVPWPTVHKILCEAAFKTGKILDDPAPFVLQTSLDDNYVAYELNAYTRYPSSKQQISSDMHSHILDGFQAAQIEILSPHYRANRDGNPLTVPPAISMEEAKADVDGGSSSEDPSGEGASDKEPKAGNGDSAKAKDKTTGSGGKDTSQ